jgi:hypothetical protein
MLAIARSSLVLALFPFLACAQQDVLAWFPLQPGSRWIYDYEWKSGDRNYPEVDRWTTEVTVTGWVTIPEGIVVLRDAKQEGGKTITGWMIAPNGQRRYVQHQNVHPVTRDQEPFLIHAACVYGIGGGWDARRQQLLPEYEKDLTDGALVADFCFPLETGQHWGNNDVPWSVEPASAGVASFLPSRYAGAPHLFSSHFGSGGWLDVWFQKGTGVVGERYIHNGTYDEYTKTLRSFAP